uniref:Disease resistance protein At4g27190-like leucine-rich repeats domain-containing protein n=1 Tax=Fagus sylvatica TaxID=28930 RepID=A0A2N9G0N4_FAGSY
MSLEILPKLSRLQYLAVYEDFPSVTVKGEEVASLKNLETFGGLFSDMYEFSTYMRSLEKGRLATYEIHVGKPFTDLQLKEKDTSAQVPPHTFSRLKRIDIYQCSKLKKPLSPGLLLHLHNLEEIDVACCEQLEEIIEEEEEEKEEEGMDTTKITLPRLKRLWLRHLPELKSVCSSSKVISCDSLKKILIYRCPKLKRLPLSLPLLNGQLSPPPSLKQIEVEEEWWESLEWDSQDTKNVLQPFLRKPR